MVAVGTNSRISSSRFGPTSSNKIVTPVRLPPGRFRLATSPDATGLSPTEKTIGIVVVAAFAATTAGPFAAITATCRRTRSAASAGSRSLLTLREAVFDRDVLALDVAGFLQAQTERGQEVSVRPGALV